MLKIPSILEERLRQVRAESLLRELSLPFGEDFCSNDYLGFASDPELRGRMQALGGGQAGSTGSRLLRGDSETHREVEKRLARFSEREDALLFPSGYQANVGVFSSLLTARDRVYSDAANHASIIDGLRLSGSEKRIYRHSELSHLEALLRSDATCPGLKLIATESLFSMDGDFARLEELSQLAERHDAWLVVDEAHATGLWGAGRVSWLGLEKRVLATVHTGGKALGAAGAWVACSTELKAFLLNFSRAQIFSTSISPLLARALGEAVNFHGEVGAIRSEELRKKIRLFHSCAGILPAPSEPSPIVPWLLGSAENALNASRSLREQGLDARAIRPPTVPSGRSRLRITLKWTNSDSEIRRLAGALEPLAGKGEVS